MKRCARRNGQVASRVRSMVDSRSVMLICGIMEHNQCLIRQITIFPCNFQKAQQICFDFSQKHQWILGIAATDLFWRLGTQRGEPILTSVATMMPCCVLELFSSSARKRIKQSGPSHTHPQTTLHSPRLARGPTYHALLHPE